MISATIRSIKYFEKAWGVDMRKTFFQFRLGFIPTGNLLNKDDEKEDAPKPGVAHQATLRSHINGYQLDPNSSVILNDIGGPGSNNGVIDAGEWIQLNVGILNDSEQRWHSTSGWFSFDSTCTWTKPATEIVLAELDPKQSAQVPIWIYVSEHCQSEKVPLTLVVQDTHQTGGQPLATNMDLHIRALEEVSPWAVLFDKDLPGSSNPINKNKIYPNESIELNSGINAGGEAISARQAFDFGKQGQNLIVKSSHHNTPMPKVRPGLRAAGATSPAPQHSFIAGDDLDFQTVGKEAFYQSLTTMAQAYHWKAASDYRMLIAMDVEIQRPSPQNVSATADTEKTDQPITDNGIWYTYRRFLKAPLMRWNAPPVTVTEICDDGIDNDNDTAIDCADTECKPLKACQKPTEYRLPKPFGRSKPAETAPTPQEQAAKSLSIDLGIPTAQVGLVARAVKGQTLRFHGMIDGVLHIENTLLKVSAGASLRFLVHNRVKVSSLMPMVVWRIGLQRKSLHPLPKGCDDTLGNI